MLEIAWRNPERVIRPDVTLVKTWGGESVDGYARFVYQAVSERRVCEITYELLVNRSRTQTSSAETQWKTATLPTATEQRIVRVGSARENP